MGFKDRNSLKTLKTMPLKTEVPFSKQQGFNFFDLFFCERFFLTN